MPVACTTVLTSTNGVFPAIQETKRGKLALRQAQRMPAAVQMARRLLSCPARRHDAVTSTRLPQSPAPPNNHQCTRRMPVLGEAGHVNHYAKTRFRSATCMMAWI